MATNALATQVNRGKGGGRGGRPKPPGERPRGKGEGRGGGKGGGRGGGEKRHPVPKEYLKKNFDEGCFYCGDPGHGRSKCPQLTAKLKAQGFRRAGGQRVPTGAAGKDNFKEDI